MKKRFILLVSVVVLTLSTVSVAYAGYLPVSNPIQTGYVLGQKLGAQGHIIVDVGCNASRFDYKVTIGLGSLSDICTEANGIGITCSLYFNSQQNVYVIRVHDKKVFGLVNTTGCIANANGYIYTAAPEFGGNTTTNNTYNFNQTIINNPGGSAGSSPGYGGDVSSSKTDRELQEDIYFKTWYIGEYIHLLVDWTKIIEDEVYALYRQVNDNVVPALSAVNDNLISFKDSAISELGSIYTVLEYTHDVQLNALNVQNRIYSSVVGISSRLDTLVSSSVGITSRLDSVINNGAVQVNTSSIDARLDKLISMYSKVNSVVLDTASVTGGQIKEAVGGQLDDVVFWGNSSRVFPYLQSAPVNYTLNGETAQYQLTAPDGTPIVLRMVALGSSIPAYIANDPVLSAGVWRSGNTYVISDTYNATTGVYTQRIKEYVFTGTESGMGVRARANGSVLFWRSYTGDAQLSARSSHFTFVDSSPAIHPDGSTDLTITNNTCTYYNGRFALASTSLTTLDGWKTWLAKQYAAGTPVTMYYVDGAVSGWTAAPVSIGSGQTIPIPEGDSLISADLLRITAKYETYGSYTRTADIISAINGLSLGTYDDTNVIAAITSLESTLSKPAATVTADLTEVTSRLDTLIDNSASKIENTTIDITNDNDAFNVFYITGDDGETQPITDFAKDLSSASGKFLSVLYRLAFSDALNSASSDLGNLEDFFTSTEPEETSTQSVDSAVEEVDVWSAF